VEASETWSRLSGGLLGQAAASERGLELKAAHWNKEIVRRHGRYDFRPELPEPISEMIEILTEYDQLKRRHSAATVSSALAKLYGSIAQNYGFCGPQYLREVERYVALAQQAFGAGLVQDAVDDWQRQFGYLFYALADAGDMKHAGEALAGFIGRPLDQCREQDFNRMNPYQHAAVSRFLAESEESPHHYLKWVSRHVFDVPMQHPWQLWLTNAGHFLDDDAMKRAAWSRSVELCFNLGAAVRPMALLPLASLWHSGLSEPGLLESRTLEVMNVCESPKLSRHHFRSLQRSTRWQDILAETLADQSRLFPFTYR
jgi:hypothetical protein